MEINAIFQRVEKKYLLNPDQYAAFMRDISDYMQPDQYGKHTICNLYLDTKDHLLIRRSIEKPPYKEKVRLRSYGVPGPDSQVFLEIKKKVKGVVYKRRIACVHHQAISYLNGGPPLPDSQIFREIDYMIRFYGLVPMLYLAYDRIALTRAGDPASPLRITLDQNIRSRETCLDLSQGDEGKYLTPRDQWLMEVKAPGAMPLWLVSILSKERIRPASFSKYGAVYTANYQAQRSAVSCSKASSPIPREASLLLTR